MLVPKPIKPMLARDNPFFKNPFNQKNYVLQEKLDGTRIIAIYNKKWYLMTRHWKNDVSLRFPEVIKDLNTLPIKTITLDGELTFFKNNKDVFMTVLANPETKKDFVAKYMIFDIIELNGKQLTSLPLLERMKLLKQIIPSRRHIELVKTSTTPSTFKKVYNTIIKNKGEGVIIKDKDSKYLFDSRFDWIKIKGTYTEDCVVVGITYGTGKRLPTMGALVLAQYDKDNNLKIVGKASGFDDATLKYLYENIMKMSDYSYPNFSMKDVKKWIRPKIVVEVRYFEKTSYGILRHPVFLRIRDDKLPSQCRISP
jgi:ATP-dependent DNA ligase